MKADALEKSLIFVFVYVVKLHPTNHTVTLLTVTPPTLAQPDPLWLELPVNIRGFRGKIRRRKQWTTGNPPNRKSNWGILCSGPHTLEAEMLVCN